MRIKLLILLFLFPAGVFAQQGKSIAPEKKIIATDSTALLLPPPFSFNSLLCGGFDTVIYIPILGDSLTIDSVRLEGFDNSYVGANLPDALKGGDKKFISLSFHPLQQGLKIGLLRIHYVVGTQGYDTTIAITGNFRTRGTTNTIVHDILDGGDTISVPIYLTNNSGELAQGFSLHALFNTDLLMPLDPEFKGTLTGGAVIWDQNTLPDGLNIFVHQQFAVSSSEPLVILKFKTYVTKEPCTSFKIDSLNIFFDSTFDKNAPCPLVVISDSAMICRSGCGEPTIRAFLNTGKIPFFEAFYDSRNEKISLHDEIKSSHIVEVLNLLGQLILSKEIGGASPQYLNAASLPSGIYIVRTSDGNRKYSQKIIISR